MWTQKGESPLYIVIDNKSIYNLVLKSLYIFSYKL